MLGLHAEISVRVVFQVESELKMVEDKNKNTIWALLWSLFTDVNNYFYSELLQ